MYCADDELGSCVAEAISRCGKNVYLCNDAEETAEVSLSAPLSFFFVLFVECFPGGEIDIGELMLSNEGCIAANWNSLAPPRSYGSIDDLLVQREFVIDFFRLAFIEYCRLLTTVR